MGPARPFSVILPYAPGTARIALAGAGREMAERPVSSHPPAVHVLAPNGGETIADTLAVHWEGVDEDGDALLYTVQYSADEGATWQALVTNHPAVTLTVDALALPGSERALIRVIATDGVNTDSDRSDGPFIVPPHPPTAVIVAPVPGARFTRGQLILLTGATLDAEEGSLPSDALTWASDRDGLLGVGSEIAVSDLAPGRHIITLTAADSDGQTGMASVEIFVGQSQLYLPLVLRNR